MGLKFISLITKKCYNILTSKDSDLVKRGVLCGLSMIWKDSKTGRVFVDVRS